MFASLAGGLEAVRPEREGVSMKDTDLSLLSMTARALYKEIPRSGPEELSSSNEKRPLLRILIDG